MNRCTQIFADYSESAKGIFASVFGWDGDKDAAIAFEDGSFQIRDNKNIIVGFSIFNSPKSFKWYNHSGYLPCLVTEFERDNCFVKIMNFGDKVTVKGNDYVIAYSRVAVHNKGHEPYTLYPDQSASFIILNYETGEILPNQNRNYDFAIAIDRFGNSCDWPSDEEILTKGSWDYHFESMKRYWDDKLAEIAQVITPDSELNNAYKAGFIYTHIVKDGYSTNVGENGYKKVFDHDAVGVLVSLLTIGNFREAKEFLTRLPVGTQYNDATWKYPWPFALYLLKTDGVDFIRTKWDVIKNAAHRISDDRTGSGGIMKMTSDIDSDGYWTVDNWSGMIGLLAYKYICERLGELEEGIWADSEYNSLLEATNKVLTSTIKQYNLNYIPASMIEPNEFNRTHDPKDGNWASQFFFGRWAWDGWLLGGEQYGVSLDMIDSTYEHGFSQLKMIGFPEHTFGGFPGYCSAYNSGFCGAALRGNNYRTEGIKAYQFMISNTQSGPFSWWENASEPEQSGWEGTHPKNGTGSCPHIWGQASATKVLIDSIIAEFFNGKILIGRGIPNDWLAKGAIEVSNFPISSNKRVTIRIETIDKNKVQLTISGDVPSNDIVFNLPIFSNNIVSSTEGVIDNLNGTIILLPKTRHVEVELLLMMETFTT